jgi:hypothetical protein
MTTIDPAGKYETLSNAEIKIGDMQHTFQTPFWIPRYESFEAKRGEMNDISFNSTAFNLPSGLGILEL